MNRPTITLSYAQSLDGRIATRTGESQWISGPQTLQMAQELRRDNQAILVGIQTVLRDNPRLTCRIEGARQPIRIVLDSQLRIPLECHLTTVPLEAPTWVFCRSNADEAKKNTLRDRGIQVIELPSDQGGLQIPALLQYLHQQDVKTLFVEGGAGVLTAFLHQRLCDRLVVVTAPILIGQGISAIGDLGVVHLPEALRPSSSKSWPSGEDTVTELIF